MKVWHVTGTVLIGSVEPIPFFPCRIFLWGWIRPISIDLGRVVVPPCLCEQSDLDWLCFWVINLQDSNCLRRDPLSLDLQRCAWRFFRHGDRRSCLLLTRFGFCPRGLDPPTERKDTVGWSTWRITSRGFFLYGTWSWPKGCNSDISSYLALYDGSTRGVVVGLSLSNRLHFAHHRRRNNLWWDT